MPNPEQRVPFSSIDDWVERLSKDNSAFRAELEDALAGMCEEQQSDLLRMLNRHHGEGEAHA